MRHTAGLRTALSATMLMASASAAFPWPAWLKSGILDPSTIGYYYGAVYQTLHNFNPAAGDGGAPESGLTPIGIDGGLVGTTSKPGSAYAVFGASQEDKLIALASGTRAPLTYLDFLDYAGVEPAANGRGDAFILSVNPATATATKQVIFTFPGGKGGDAPISALLQNPGTTEFFGTASGGSLGGGIVYKLAPQSNGTWQETVLTSFSKGGKTGAIPSGNLSFGYNTGILVGSTAAGGKHDFGTVFTLTTKGKLTTLYSFAGGTDGAAPGSLISHNGLDFFGATSKGGNDQGTVFKINTKGTYQRLYSFANTMDGHTPNTGLVMDTSGALYGTAQGGGYGHGTAWVLVPPARPKASWKLELLHSFGSDPTDGKTPAGRLAIDTQGNVYGVASAGGAYGAGVAYEITP